MQLATFSTATARGEHPAADTLRQVIRGHDQLAPRSLQSSLGPSEIGEPCPRRLAYRLMGEQRVNTGSDPWPAIVGTAVHAWLAEAFLAANTWLGRIRYLVETRVTIREGLSGSCDLYDVDTARVIDHKVVGETAMREYKRNGPPQQYRAQAHLYGVGLARLGLPVSEVCLAFYPRGGMLAGLHVWAEPFDPAIAAEALARHDRVLEAACALDVDRHPDHYGHIPAATGHRCTWCPWFAPGTPVGATCPGHMAR
ncbi:hypothetical protein SAMN02982929_05328 [Saccharopolyspora kobensis]|uniref:PD-(D/E)XK nuclease superfamily protein n=2 Tax=Saccharopolyspora kobensis TaxID=146035 RepID=A0A1H6E1Q6_9PSEU|nr:hypothetical protein SAMN02982929_05328 [Saccharopolyspora kobensis]SFD94314.1 hypothetical protein SAMN05216506_107304 [Saccharopolyspora kobensis]